MIDILMSEICWAHKEWNKIASDMKLVFHSSTITMMHGPINIRLSYLYCISIRPCHDISHLRLFFSWNSSIVLLMSLFWTEERTILWAENSLLPIIYHFFKITFINFYHSYIKPQSGSMLLGKLCWLSPLLLYVGWRLWASAFRCVSFAVNYLQYECN